MNGDAVPNMLEAVCFEYNIFKPIIPAENIVVICVQCGIEKPNKLGRANRLKINSAKLNLTAHVIVFNC